MRCDKLLIGNAQESWPKCIYFIVFWSRLKNGSKYFTLPT